MCHVRLEGRHTIPPPPPSKTGSETNITKSDRHADMKYQCRQTTDEQFQVRKVSGHTVHCDIGRKTYRPGQTGRQTHSTKLEGKAKTQYQVREEGRHTLPNYRERQTYNTKSDRGAAIKYQVRQADRQGTMSDRQKY